ncbi:MAG: hypothetical protein LBQ22_08755 [Bacteroidales bacterium]|jgi:hypothetical protein|nr:hypothetical protein [Bacteroidales bacterium]
MEFIDINGIILKPITIKQDKENSVNVSDLVRFFYFVKFFIGECGITKSDLKIIL